MKPIIKKFKTGDKLEINSVENGFIIVHRKTMRASLMPIRARRLPLPPEEEFEEEFEEDCRSKCYIAESPSDVTKIISEMMQKDSTA